MVDLCCANSDSELKFEVAGLLSRRLSGLGEENRLVDSESYVVVP